MLSTNTLVLITGATGGIGQATALVFAKQGGYDLALQYNTASSQTRSDLQSALEAAVPTAQSIPKIQFFQADLSDFAQVRNLHASIVQSLGHPSILFANAGSTCGVSGVQSLSTLPFDLFEQAWRINTGAVILLTQLCLPFMEERGWGRVVFCSSVAAWTGGGVGPHYAASKSGLHGFLHWLAGNVAGKGVTVNAVAPAIIEGTGMMGSADDEGVMERVKSSKWFRACEGGRVLTCWNIELPVGRMGRPEEVAETVMWMVKTGYLTSKVIGIDGGYYPH